MIKRFLKETIKIFGYFMIWIALIAVFVFSCVLNWALMGEGIYTWYVAVPLFFVGLFITAIVMSGLIKYMDWVL
jgi:hypothetical protein